MSRLLTNLLVGLGSGLVGAVALTAAKGRRPRTRGVVVLGLLAGVAAGVAWIAKRARHGEMAELGGATVNTRDSGMIH